MRGEHSGREKRICKGTKVGGLGMGRGGLGMFKNRQKACVAAMCTSLRRAILVEGLGQDADRITSSALGDYFMLKRSR